MIQTDNSDSTFIDQDQNVEIFVLSDRVLELKEAPFITTAINQAEAFKNFKKKYPSLYIKSTKKYMEKVMDLSVM